MQITQRGWLVLLLIASSTVVAQARDPLHPQGENWDLTPPSEEPRYQSKPLYALLVFGQERERRVWMVLDGNALYVDRDADGDLTEPEEKLVPDNPTDGSNLFSGSGSHTHYDVYDIVIDIGPTDGESLETTHFVLHRWVPAADFVPRSEFDRRVLGERQRLGYANSTLWRKKGRGKGQTPLLFMPDPDDAQVCALDGPLALVLKDPEGQVLRRGVEAWDVAFNIAVLGRSPRGIDRPFHNALATDEVPESAYLDVEIEFPAEEPPAPPIRRTYALKDRC